MINNESNNLNKNIIHYEPGFIKINRMKCYRMLNDDIVFQEKKLQRLLKRNQMEAYSNNNENKDIPNSNKDLYNENIDKNIDNNIEIHNSNNSNSNSKIFFYDNNNEENNDNIKEQKQKYLKRNYIYGLNYSKSKNKENKNVKYINDNNNIFVYHKKDKWIAFPNSDCIIVYKYSNDNNNKNFELKEQQLLHYHKNRSYIKSVKLSLAENILYFYTIDNYLIFYKYDIQNQIFNYISEYHLKYKITINDYIIDQNEIFCFIFYDNYKMTILDYELCNELLNIDINFLKQYQYKNIKLNKFTEHRIEFCVYSKENYATYYLDTKELKLNESINNINLNKNEIICLEYLPPLSDCILLCLIVCFKNGDIFIINLNFNNILQKYKVKYNIYDIIISPFYINFISEEKLLFYNIPNLRSIKFHEVQNINLLNEKYLHEIKHDSNIVNYSIDSFSTNGYALIFTEKGTLFVDNYKKDNKIRLNNFLYEDQYITQCLIMKNINDNESNNNSYYLITTHNHGLLKIYGIPTYEVIYEFSIENDEISYIIQIPKKLYFLVFSKKGFVRCFDLNRAQCTGKLKIIDIISKDRYSTIPTDFNTYIKKAIFYPCGKFFIGVESYENNLILFTIDNIAPFSLKSKQIPYIQINTLNDIDLNKIEPYQTFLITNNNNEIFVYERKYSSLITTFDLENDTPIYQKKDYINNDTLVSDENFSLLIDKNKINQNTCFYGFDTEYRERHYLYIFNYKSNSIILRDTKARKTLNIFKLNEPINSLIFLNNSKNFIIFMGKEKINIYNINEVEQSSNINNNENSITKIKNKNNINNLIISDDDIIITLINGNSFIVYSIMEE